MVKLVRGAKITYAFEIGQHSHFHTRFDYKRHPIGGIPRPVQTAAELANADDHRLKGCVLRRLIKNALCYPLGLCVALTSGNTGVVYGGFGYGSVRNVIYHQKEVKK
jgi:hypothetical protein